MINELSGSIDYDVHGAGPTIVLVPSSCSTGSAWRKVMAAWRNHSRCVTTSLLGYGGTAERRTAFDPSILHEASVVHSVIRRAGDNIHLVGHSFGGLAALALALTLRNSISLASLTIIEAPTVGLLQSAGERRHYDAFRRMTDAYLADFEAGNAEAIAAMIDFYGGDGTFASWPQRLRDVAIETTPVNVLDWASVYGFQPSADALAALRIPTLVISGGDSHPAMQRANALLAASLGDAEHITLEGAAHFMIATHPENVALLIASHVNRAEVELHWRA